MEKSRAAEVIHSTNEVAIGNRIPADKIYTFVYQSERLRCRGYSSLGKEIGKSIAGEKVPASSYEIYLVNN